MKNNTLKVQRKKMKVEMVDNYPSWIYIGLFFLICAFVFGSIVVTKKMLSQMFPKQKTEAPKLELNLRPSEEWKEEEGGFFTLPIKNIKWVKDLPFTSHFHEIGEPIILNDTFVTDNWPPFQKWDFEYLKSRTISQKIGNIFKNVNERFGPSFDPKKPMNSLSFVNRVNPYVVMEMEAKQFWRKMERRNPMEDPNYYYFSENVVSVVEQMDILEDIERVNWLELGSQSDTQNINLWVGQKGVVTHAHYDSFDNFIVQIRGEKRWTLFPPNITDTHLHYYPFLHPSHAQSQIDLTDVNKRLFEKFKGARGLSGVLKAGQVLYVPAFWTHFVEALSPTISFNAWSFTSQSDSMSTVFEIFDVYRPLEGYDKQFQKIMAAKCFLSFLLKALDPAASLKNLINSLMEMRYRPLVRSQSFQLNLDDVYKFSETCESTYAKQQQVSICHKIEKHVSIEKIASIFRTIPDSTKKIWIFNFVELVLAHAVSLDKISVLLSSSCLH